MGSDTAAPFLYLLGPPGVGKQTVGRALVKILPNARMIDNHLIIDLARAVFTQGSAEYEGFRKTLRIELLKAISTSPSARDVTFIFTGAHSTRNSIGSQIAGNFQHAAAERGAPFVSIVLSCARDEHMNRVVHPARVSAPYPKLIDVATVTDIVESGGIFRFGCEHELDIDTTGREPKDVAKEIAAYVLSLTQEGTATTT